MMAVPLLLLVQSSAAASGPVTAEQALDAYRHVIKPTAELDCSKGGNGEEIVVCGRRSDAPHPNRLPLPVEPEPGRRIPGELSVDGGGCMRLCYQPVMVPLVDTKGGGIIGKVADGVKRILGGDD